MALAMPWMLLVAAGAALLAVAVGLLLGRLGSRPDPGAADAAVARAERLRGMPSVAAAVRRRTVALAAIIALGAGAALAAGLVAARPMAAKTVNPVMTNRDIMLCLDVSGSMSEVDVEVLEVFEELLPGFEGERVGLTIFNSSPVRIFPLTDDYSFIREHLADIRRSFDYVDEIPEHWVGTLNGPGGSLIGDGLAACAMGFDHPGEDRSRTIILATDNEVNGAETVSIEQAAQYARSLGVRVFALNPIQDETSPESRSLVEAATLSGGQAYGLRDTTTVGDIVADIRKQEAAELLGEAQVVWSDAPDTGIVVVLVAALGFVILLWRVRL